MPPKKTKAKSKGKNQVDDTSSTHSNEPLSQVSKCSQRSRAKKYTKEESDLLVKICSEFRKIIDINSNSTADVKNKKGAWERIKQKFDARCRAEAIYVSFFKM